MSGRGAPSPRRARRKRWLARLLASTFALSVLAPVVAAADADSLPSCTQRVLRDLGWRIGVGGAGPDLHIEAGTPCDRADLADAHAHGDLRILVPRGHDPHATARALDAVLAHPASVCAYAFRLGDATRRATARLAGNPGYRFSALQLGWIGFGRGGPEADGWTRIASFGRAFQPQDSNRRAIDGFYRGRVRSECGVGRQIAQLATQAELYGDAFDDAFAADELVIGTFNQLHGTRSILLGSSAGEFTRDGRARIAARQGRQAFAGLPGFIEHVFDRSMLDDIHNQAENFVVVDVGAEAAAALRAHGGFEHYNGLARELWTISRDVHPYGVRAFEKLLVERDASMHAALSATQRARIARMDAILADPFFRQFQVYVHPKGIKPVGYHFVRLLDRNPRTPFRIELVLHNLHTTLYRRYLDHLLASCEAGPRRVGDAVASITPGEFLSRPRIAAMGSVR